MKTKNVVKVFIGILIILLLIFGVVFIPNKGEMPYKRSESEIKLAARRASVQVNNYLPIIKVSFTTPLPKDQPFDRSVMDEVLESKLSELQERLEKLMDEKVKPVEKYEASLTSIEMYGHEPKSRSEIPIGSLKGVPEYARYPEKVLVVYKTDKKDISPWDKEAEKDVLAISETAGVSISKAKEMLTRIKSEGYTVSKEAISEESEVKLLWFRGSWDASYPTTLDWKVYLEGEECNLITGYDPRGILSVKTIPEGKRVYVSAGYIDLKSEFKPESSEVKSLKGDIERLEKAKEELQKEKADLEAKLKKDEKPYKRDISKATWGDLMYGIIKLEVSWWMSQASGVFLGNSKTRQDMESYSYKGMHNIYPEEAGFVLTNAHVARMAIAADLFVSKDKEVMVIIGPGIPSVRYTAESDAFGSPAFLLAIDNSFVFSPDYDCAIMVTSKVPQYSQYAAVLGDSDRVVQGTKIVTVGNPSGFQKFASEGIVSNVSQPFIHAMQDKGEALKHNPYLLRPSMWLDAPIGIGGVSGSGVWALEGTERGKVISLRNSGLVVFAGVSEWTGEDFRVEGVKYADGEDIGASGFIKDITPEQRKAIFRNHPYREASFIEPGKVKDESVKLAMDSSYYYVGQRVAGMNMAVPINAIKTYLQERGIDPKEFGWEGLSKGYWEK